MIKQSSYTITKAEMANKKWFVVDATDMVVGRLASEVAKILKGKHKPQYTTHNDAGDYVIVVNAEKVKFTGNKWNAKIYKLPFCMYWMMAGHGCLIRLLHVSVSCVTYWRRRN